MLLGRIIGRVDNPSADVLVPTVLHTTDPNILPVSMRPQTLNVSRIPNDAFVVYLMVVSQYFGRGPCSVTFVGPFDVTR